MSLNRMYGCSFLSITKNMEVFLVMLFSNDSVVLLLSLSLFIILRGSSVVVVNPYRGSYHTIVSSEVVRCGTIWCG